MFDFLRFLKYLPLLKVALELLRDLGSLPSDWTNPQQVKDYLHEAEPEIAAVVVAVAEIIAEARDGDKDDPVIVGRLEAAIRNARVS